MREIFKSTASFFGRVWQGMRMLPKVRSRHLPQIFESLTKKDFTTLAVLMVIILLSGGFLVHAYFYSAPSNIPDYGGEHVEGLVGQPRFINPVLAGSSSVDSDLSRLIYSQLLTFDENLKLAPELAALPDVSSDQKTYTVHLRPNLKWQDGQPLTADDVVYTVQTIQNPDYDSPLLSTWSHVKVEKIDDQTIKFTLRQVSASFENNFTLAIIPKHVWGDLSPNNFRLSDANLKPVGSGPYSVHEIKKTTDGTIKSITLQANSQYFQGEPYISQFTFKFYADEQVLMSAYQSRDIQALGFVPFDNKVFLEASTKSTEYKTSLPQYQAVFFNLPKNPVLSQKGVRQALWLATDRSQIVNDVYLGLAQPAYSPIVSGNLGYNPNEESATHYSISEADSILDKAGFQLDPQANQRYQMVTQGSGANKTKVRRNLEFNLVTNVSPLNVKTAMILQQQWAQIGATVHIITVSSSDLQENYIRPRNFDALLFSENTGADPDPFVFWHSSQARDPGLNLSGFSHSTVDKLLTDARQTSDTNLRVKDYQQFQDIVTQEIPAIFLDSALYVYTLPAKEHGFDLSKMVLPSDRYNNVKDWYIETKRK